MNSRRVIIIVYDNTHHKVLVTRYIIIYTLVISFLFFPFSKDVNRENRHTCDHHLTIKAHRNACVKSDPVTENDNDIKQSEEDGKKLIIQMQ